MIKFRKLGIVMKPLKDQFGSFARFNPGVQLKDGIVPYVIIELQIVI